MTDWLDIDGHDVTEQLAGHIGGTVADALADAENAPREALLHRVDDLESQILFLDSEIGRYREIIERQRIEHSTRLANLQLKLDTQRDELERKRRNEAKELHTSYRRKLAEQQIENEKQRSVLKLTTTNTLTDQQEKAASEIRKERSRREAAIEAAERHLRDEMTRTHASEMKVLRSALAQAKSKLYQADGDSGDHARILARAENRAVEAERQADMLDRRLTLVQDQFRSQLADANRQIGDANRRLAAERNKMAATLSELLQRSASIAGEADRAKTEYVARLETIEQSSTSEVDQTKAAYDQMAQAAEARASQAIEREAELENVIAELRAELAQLRLNEN